jgi:hypothetical protein
MAITKINTKLIANNTIALTNIADNAIDATKIASNNILARHIPNATDMTLGGLTVDTTTLVVDATNNRVGIGTASPGDELHLYANNPAIRLEDSDGGYGRVLGVNGNIYYQADEGNGESSSFHRWDIDGTDNVMRLDATGLGLGTTGPTDIIHISTSSDSVGRFESTDATAYIRINDTDDSLYVTTAGQKGSFGGNASVHKNNINIDLTNGNTSIGTTVTTNGKLSVYNTESDTVSPALYLSQYNAAQDDRNTFSVSCDGPNNLAIFNSSGTNSGGYAWQAGGTERMRMSAAGRLVIGHNASISNGVASKLQIYNAGNEGSLSLGRWGAVTSPPYLTFMKSRGANVGDNTILNDNDIIGEIRWRAADGVNFNAEAAAIHCRVDGTPGADDMPGELHFQTTADGADSATSKMIIKPNGNVGIGTSDAQTLLELSAHNAAGQNTLRFTDEDTGIVADQTIGKIEFYTKDGTGDGASVRSYILSAAEDTSPSTYLSFAVNEGGVGTATTERMRLNSHGGLTVGGAGDSAGSWFGTDSGVYIDQENANYGLIIRSASADAGIGFAEGGSGRFYLKSIDGADGLRFIDGNNSDEHMRIDENGRVGINENDPQSTLDVDGTIVHGNIRNESAATNTYTDGNALHGGVIEFTTTISGSGEKNCVITWAKGTWSAFSYEFTFSAASWARKIAGGGYHNGSGGTISGHEKVDLYGENNASDLVISGSGQTIVFTIECPNGTHPMVHAKFMIGGSDNPDPSDFSVEWVAR